ncbi:MAG: hypothetical protein ACI9S8_000860 [Chlamydiales bacterium]|jgi:hypothetical protein
MTIDTTSIQTLQYLFPSCQLQVVVANEDRSEETQLPVRNFQIQGPEIGGVLTRNQRIDLIANSSLTILAMGEYYGSSTRTDAPIISFSPEEYDYSPLSERTWASINVRVQLFNTTTEAVTEIAQQTFHADVMQARALQEEQDRFLPGLTLRDLPLLSDFSMNLQNDESTVAMGARELHRFNYSPMQVSAIHWRDLSLERVARG